MAFDFYYEKWQLFPTNTLHLGEVPKHVNCCPSVSDNSFSTLKKIHQGHDTIHILLDNCSLIFESLVSANPDLVFCFPINQTFL